MGKKPYKAPDSVKRFRQYHWEMQCARHPLIPSANIPVTKFRDDTANGLTQTIIAFVNDIGGAAERISSMGRYVQGEARRDIFGRVQVSGGKYIRPTSTNGTADISATIMGRSVKVEVKIGRDRQSEAQKAYQARVEAAGAIYFIANDFDGFLASLEQYGLLPNNPLK